MQTSGTVCKLRDKKESLTEEIKAMKTVYQANCAAEKNRLTDVPRTDNQKRKKL